MPIVRRFEPDCGVMTEAGTSRTGVRATVSAYAGGQLVSLYEDAAAL